MVEKRKGLVHMTGGRQKYRRARIQKRVQETPRTGNKHQSMTLKSKYTREGVKETQMDTIRKGSCNQPTGKTQGQKVKTPETRGGHADCKRKIKEQ